MVVRGDNNEDRNYQNGTRALDAGRWDEAVEYFTRVVNQNGTRADGAMYWIAWALNKQGNGAAALEWLARMRQDVSGKPLAHRRRARSAVEIRQRAGQPVKPENVPDEELRLMALNSLARADEQRAMPDARENRERHRFAAPQRARALCAGAERIARSPAGRHQDRARRQSRICRRAPCSISARSAAPRADRRCSTSSRAPTISQ